MSRINFVRGVPADEVFPRAEILDSARAVVMNNESPGLRYGDAAGPHAMRDWVAQAHGVDIERVVLGNGSMGIFDLLCRATLAPGDAIMLEEPCYDRVIELARLSGLKPQPIALRSGALDIDALRKAATQTKARYFYGVPDFQNPSGATYPLDVRHDLITAARDLGFKIIEDSPYRRLRYDGEDLPSLFELAPDVTIHLTSFSKIIAPGLRAAYALAPPDVIAAIKRMAESTYVTPGNLALSIAGAWLSAGRLEPQIARLNQFYRPRRDAMVKALRRHFSSDAYTPPEGGFFVGVRLGPGIDVTRLQQALAAEGIDIQDGRGFFVDDPGDTFIRLPFAAISTADIERGVGRLAAHAQP